MPPPAPCREPDILLVDDDPAIVHSMAQALVGVGRLRFATGGAQALRLAAEHQPDLVLLDAEMPDMTGFEVCARLKDGGPLAEVPVIFVTSHRDPSVEVGGFLAGAADFITKPFDPRRVRARVLAQLRAKAAADELRRASATDPLTGVGNRRAFDGALQREWQRSLRSAVPLSLLLLDVDQFKLYNDEYGHPAGDDCLRLVAQTLASACQRPADAVYRYGGEEFAVLLPQTARAGAEHMGWRLLSGLERLGLEHRLAPLGRVTASVGISSYDEDCGLWREHGPDSRFGGWPAEPPRAADLLAACDRALYLAKHRGRARACVRRLGGRGDDVFPDAVDIVAPSGAGW